MIYFNGTALESVAPVKISDIMISPIRLTMSARQRPIQFGADFVRITGGSRTVSITFALLVDNNSLRQTYLQRITDWARSDTPKKMYLPGNDGRYLEVICTALPDTSMRQWWESKLRLTFTTANNPFWTSDAEYTATCGDAFFVQGSAPPLMWITETFSSDYNLDIDWALDDDEMTVSAVPEGVLKIDLNRQTIDVDGTSIMANYVPTSTFLIPRTGAQTITGMGTIHWRERWQ